MKPDLLFMHVQLPIRTAEQRRACDTALPECERDVSGELNPACDVPSGSSYYSQGFISIFSSATALDDIKYRVLAQPESVANFPVRLAFADQL